MSKLLFDGTAMQHDADVKFHGGGEYAIFICRSAIESGYSFDVVLDKNKLLDDDVLNTLKAHSVPLKYIYDRQELYQLIDADGYDVFYSAQPYDYFDYTAHAKFIGVIHGLRWIELLWDEYQHKYESSAIQRLKVYTMGRVRPLRNVLLKHRLKKVDNLLAIPGSRFITVSNHSKYSILSHYPRIAPSSIAVHYSPFTVPEYDECVKKEKYFLLVSGNRFEKNIYRAMKAFDELFSAGLVTDYKVVITGAAKLPFIKEIKHIDKFELLSYVSLAELYDLHARAFCFVYPSLNEGFGYPPLVAMSQRTPVIASCATSIPEACGDAAMYFTPTNLDDLKSRILQIIDNEPCRRALIAKGVKRVNELLELQRQDIPRYLNEIFSQK